MIDVWQGDAILIIMPNKSTILIDSGDLNAGEKVLRYLKKVNITELDVIVVTHPHADHLGGFIKVLDKIKVKKVYDSTDYYTQTYKTFRRILETKKIPRVQIIKGDKINLDPNVYIEVLSPERTENISSSNYFKKLSQQEIRSLLNNRSIVIKISYGKDAFLSTGDAEIDAENYIVSTGKIIKSNLLKAGHHGSRTSSSPKFLSKVSPDTVLISVGKGNQFGHPHSSTMSNLDKTGADVYRSDIYGDVILRTSGNGWKRDPIKEVCDILDFMDDNENINLAFKINMRIDELVQQIDRGDDSNFNDLIKNISQSDSEYKKMYPYLKRLIERLHILVLAGETKLGSKLEELNRFIK
jgi:competence protein ComEC